MNGYQKSLRFFNELQLDPRLFQKTKEVYDNLETSGLNAQQERLVTRQYESLVRNGAELEGDDKQELIRLNTELSKAFNEFSNKVLADEETYIYLVPMKQTLAGLPDSFVASNQMLPQKRRASEGWALKNTRSVMQPFLQNSTQSRFAQEGLHGLYQSRR